MKHLPLIALLVSFTNPAFSSDLLSDQTESTGLASAEDFRDYCRLAVGKWTGQVSSVASSGSVGSGNGKPQTYNFEARMASGDHAMIREVVGPDSMSTALIFYDYSANKIRTVYTSSTGAISVHTIHRTDTHWVRHTSLTAPDGSKSEFNATISFSEDGNTETIEMRGLGQDGSPWRQKNMNVKEMSFPAEWICKRCVSRTVGRVGGRTEI